MTAIHYSGPDIINSICAVNTARDLERTSPMLQCVHVWRDAENNRLRIAATDGKFLIEHIHLPLESGEGMGVTLEPGIPNGITLQWHAVRAAIVAELLKARSGKSFLPVAESFVLDAEGLTIDSKKLRLTVPAYKGGKYPQYTAAIDGIARSHITGDMGLNARYLGMLSTGLQIGKAFNCVRMWYNGRGMIFERYNNSKPGIARALIMPISLPIPESASPAPEKK